MAEELAFDPSNTMPGQALGSLPPSAAKLPPGAQNFIRGYTASEDDLGVIASFEMISEFQTYASAQASEKQGKPVEIYKDVPYVRINVRGNDKMEVHRPAMLEDKRRFPQLWTQFEAGQKSDRPGTALSVLNVPPPIIRMFHAKNVFMIEDLALVDDNNLQNLGAGAREWRHKARTFMSARPDDSDLRAQLAAAIEVMKSQGAEIAELKAKRGPGRPPKTE